MNAPTTGTQIAQDRVDRYRSYGAFGKPAWQSHLQLRAMIHQRLGERCANYFALPNYDPDTGVIRWTAAAGGPVLAWHDMTPEAQAEHGLALEVIRGELIGLANKLRIAGSSAQPGGAVAFASLLDQAMKVPADGHFLFSVGDQPVIAFWGFENQAGGSIDPAVAPPMAPALAPVMPAAAAALPAATVVAPVVVRKRPWWWLLWLLLALLLLLLGLLRGCQPDGSFDARRALPGLGGPDVAASAPGAGLRPNGQPGAPGATPPGPGGMAPGAIDPGMPGASSPGVGMPPNGSASVPGGMDVVDPNKTVDPKTDLPLDPALDPKNDPKKDPAQDPKTDPKKNPAKGAYTNGDKGQTDPPKPPLDPKALKMPDDPKAAKKMDFLQGDWKAGEGLADKETKQPLDLSLKFGADGKGEITLRKPDGTLCSGAVQSQMNAGKLSIEGNQSLPCAGGGSYGAPRIECSKSGNGQTDCQGVNRDGSRYYMDMKRK